MSLPWPIIGALAAFFTVAIMTLFSSCCGACDSDDDQSTAHPHSHITTEPRRCAIATPREPPEFLTIRYSDTATGASPRTDADARSSRSSQLSPRTTPSRRPKTPTGTSTDATGNPQDVSPSVYSQPSRPPTASSTETAPCAEPGTEGVEAASEPRKAEEKKAKK